MKIVKFGLMNSEKALKILAAEDDAIEAEIADLRKIHDEVLVIMTFMVFGYCMIGYYCHCCLLLLVF